MDDIAELGRRTPALRYGAAASRYFSISTRSSPKADSASRLAPASAAARASGFLDHAHALAAAARPGLDQHRIADPTRRLGQIGGALIVAVIARHDRHARQLPSFASPPPSSPWRASRPATARRRPARLGAGGGEIGIFRQESHSRDAPPQRPRSPRHVDDRRDVEIGVARRRPGRCGQPRRPLRTWRRVGVGVGIDRDGGDTHAPGGADHSARDLAAIGDQQLLEHRGAIVAMRLALLQERRRRLRALRPRRAHRRCPSRSRACTPRRPGGPIRRR